MIKFLLLLVSVVLAIREPKKDKEMEDVWSWLRDDSRKIVDLSSKINYVNDMMVNAITEPGRRAALDYMHAIYPHYYDIIQRIKDFQKGKLPDDVEAAIADSIVSQVLSLQKQL